MNVRKFLSVGVVVMLLLAVTIVAYAQSGKPTKVASPTKSSVPAFLEVGKSYNLIYFGDNQFTVIQVGEDGWVLVQWAKGRTVWLNTRNALLIQPL